MEHESTFNYAEWDVYAQCYDTLTKLRPYAEMIAEVANLIPRDAKSVLDLGCGTGTLLARINSIRKLQLTGLDNSPQMLAIAAKKLSNSPAKLQRGDLETMSDWGGPYDCVVSTNVLYTMNNPLLFLEHIRETVNVGGTIIVVTPKIGYDNGLILKAHCRDTRPDSFWRDPHRSPRREQRLIKEALGKSRLAKDMRTIAAHNRRIAGTGTFHFLTEQELRTLVHSAGLQLMDIHTTYADQNFLIVLTRE